MMGRDRIGRSSKYANKVYLVSLPELERQARICLRGGEIQLFFEGSDVMNLAILQNNILQCALRNEIVIIKYNKIKKRINRDQESKTIKLIFNSELEAEEFNDLLQTLKSDPSSISSSQSESPSGSHGSFTDDELLFDFELNDNSSNKSMDPQGILQIEPPVIELNAARAFENLTEQEKMYAHYLSKASWYGSLICLVQGSPESPLLYSLLIKVFGSQPVEDFKKVALEKGISSDDFQALLAYAANFLSNFTSFDHTKLIPSTPVTVFEKLITISEGYWKEPSIVDSLWEKLKGKIYPLTDKAKTIGFSNKGITTFLSSNITKLDMDLINRYLRRDGIEAYNTRVFKTRLPDGKKHYEICLASKEKGSCPGLTVDSDEYAGSLFSVTRGDYSELMGLVSENLEKAKEFASNGKEKLMIEEYIESFMTGSLNAHKIGSRHWMKNKDPVIETYIGFIETDRDSAKERADFTGWVAIVNKERSANYTKLINAAESVVPELPWGKDFEKDRFLGPNCTSLEVLTLANSRYPAWINIPNYDCIKQTEGYKCVLLGNVISSSLKDTKISFLTPDDEQLLKDFQTKSVELQIGLRELFGRGSGKLFKEDEEATLNFDINTVVNPLTGGKIDKWYGATESFDSKFSTIASSYEECRAEAVALYLSLHPKVIKIFGYEGEEAEKLVYANWLSMMWNAIVNGPESYISEKKQWLQAHAQARYVLMRVLLEAGDNLVTIVETEPGENLLLTMDRTKIHTVGKKAIKDFLLKLQVYKSLGDYDSAEKMYQCYSQVPETGSPWSNWRKIAFRHLKPRHIFVQCNTEITENSVSLKRYDLTFGGVIQSWVDRFPANPNIHKILNDLWIKNKPHFPEIESSQ